MIRIIKIIKTELQVPEPLVLDEVKEHLNIMDDDNNDKLEKLIPRCRLIIENYCNISIVQKRIVLVAEFYGWWQELPYPPVITIEAVETPESSIGSLATYKTLETGWQSEGDQFMAGVLNEWWPDDHYARFGYPKNCQRIKITYTVGMNEVPEDLKLGILNEISYRYTHLGDNETVISEEAKRIVQPYMKLWL